MATINVALLGLEQPHADFWQVVFRESDHCNFLGAWSQTPGLAAEKGKAFGFDAWDDRDALIDAADAVAHLLGHQPASSVDRGCRGKGQEDFLCEKPIAFTVDDCDHIQAVLEQTGAFYMQGFPKRFDPVNHEIRRLLDEGGIGQVTLVRVRHGHPVGMLNPRFAESWFADPEQGGGGALLDEGVHAADFLRWMFGEPEKVSCFMSDDAQKLRVEDTATAIYKYANGMIAEISSCWHFMAADNSIEIFGTTGSIVLSGVDLGSRDLTEGQFLKYYFHPQSQDESGDPLGPKDRVWTISDITPQFKKDTEVFHQNVARAFIDTIAAGGEPPVTVVDARRAVEMILAAYRSAESGRAETIQYG